MTSGLDRVLGLTDLVAFGVASIMGSGGFNLISEGIVNGGPWFPAAIGLISALFQGASKVYSEAYYAFKSNTAETDVVKAEFGASAASLTGLSILGFNIFSVSTILVFAAKNIFPKGQWHGQIGIAILILAAMSGLSLKGIELNKQVIGFFSACIVSLLAFASSIGLVEGLGPSGTPPDAYPAALSKAPNFATSVFFFYFILSGFDDLMKFTEETKDPDRDIPRSFYISNAVSTLLTVGVAYAYVHVLTLQRKGQPLHTENAIGHIIESALGKPSAEIVYWLGIFLMLITAFVSFLAVTRYLYGLGDQKHEGKVGQLLNWLQDLNTEKVPWRSVLMTFGLTAAGILMNHTSTLVRISDLFLTLVMVTVSAAVTSMKWKKDGVLPWIEGLTTAGFAALLIECCIGL
jgi:APA family basic amino acid/polyamine antiporter